jgi:hypothetical protein
LLEETTFPPNALHLAQFKLQSFPSDRDARRSLPQQLHNGSTQRLPVGVQRAEQVEMLDADAEDGG